MFRGILSVHACDVMAVLIGGRVKLVFSFREGRKCTGWCYRFLFWRYLRMVSKILLADTVWSSLR